jgi:hypothetical protein
MGRHAAGVSWFNDARASVGCQLETLNRTRGIFTLTPLTFEALRAASPVKAALSAGMQVAVPNRDDSLAASGLDKSDEEPFNLCSLCLRAYLDGRMQQDRGTLRAARGTANTIDSASIAAVNPDSANAAAGCTQGRGVATEAGTGE